MKSGRARLKEIVKLMNRLHEMLKKRGDDRISYEVNSFELAVLRYVLRLGVEHPIFHDLALPNQEAVERFLDQTHRAVFGYGSKVPLTINCLDLVLVHFVVCLGAEDPDFQNIAARSKEAVERFRDFCKRVWNKGGLSQDEANLLDRLRDGAQG